MTDTPVTQASDVQPNEGNLGAGQGGASQNGLYDLTAVPEHLREAVSPILKDIEGNVTKKLMEAADFRKTWEPYGELGITDIDPQELQELLAFRELAQDPDQFREWYDQVGSELGYGQDRDQDDLGLDDDGDDFGMVSKSDVEQMVQERLQEALAPFQQQIQEQEFEKQVQTELQSIEQELDALQEEHGEFDREKVLRLAAAYGDEKDAIARGYQDYADIVSGAQKGLISDKLGQPSTPETGGVPNTGAETVTDFNKARQMAKERIRAAASM